MLGINEVGKHEQYFRMQPSNMEKCAVDKHTQLLKMNHKLFSLVRM